MRWMIVGLLLAPPLHAGDEAEPKKGAEKIPALLRPDPRVRLPESKRAKKDEGGYGLVVNLDADGALAAGDQRVSLEELGKVLVARVEEHKEMDGPASTMRVLLRMDEKAPWIHAQWLMIQCAMKKVNRVEIAARRADGTPGYFECWLPVDAGVGLQAPKAETIRIDVFARAEKPAPYGGRQVTKPTSFVYRIGNDQFEKSDDLPKHLASLRAKAQKDKRSVRCEVRAGFKVPIGILVGVLDRCAGAGIEGIEFYGAPVPDKMERTSAVLPYPEKNYGPR